MKKVHHPSQTRGKADFGWLKANYSFSFASYFNPERVQFGMLRVLNDDTIGPGQGFGTHPHDNMEIVTIPLSGSLAHKDSMNHEEVIHSGEIQVMSAGTGVTHSEYNASQTEATNLLQLWVFPERKNVEPRYDQKAFDFKSRKNELVTVVSPKDADLTDALWLNQQTYFNLGEFDNNQTIDYKLHKKNHGVYIFVIKGSAICDDTALKIKDALGIWETESVSITTTSEAKILVIEVPMN